MSSASTSSLLSYPVSEPEPSTSTSFPRSTPPRELLKNRLYVGNLHPTVDECALHSLCFESTKRCLMVSSCPQIHPHPSLLQIWEALAARLPLSQDRCAAWQAPRLRLRGVCERYGKFSCTVFTLSRRPGREKERTCAYPGSISFPNLLPLRPPGSTPHPPLLIFFPPRADPGGSSLAARINMINCKMGGLLDSDRILNHGTRFVQDAAAALGAANGKVLRGRHITVTYAHQAPLDAHAHLGSSSRRAPQQGAPHSDSGRPTTLSLLKSVPTTRSR